MEKLNVEVGDKVIIHGLRGRKSIAVVEKITPKGFIRVSGVLYNTNGFIRGSDIWNIQYITKATVEEVYEVEHNNYRKRILNKLQSLQDITYEQAVEINKILEGEY